MTKAELIEEIVSYVYTNGRGEITGANLQDVLVDMVNILGAAAFLGVGSVQDGDTGVVTGDAVYDALNTALSNYVPTSREVNNHALTADITLTLDDIGDGVNRVLNSYFTEADGVVRLKNDYSYFKPRLGLIFDVNSVQNTPAELMKVNVGTSENPVYALKSTLPFFSDSWISAGGVSSGGGQAPGNASMQLITGGGRITNGTDTLDVYSMSNTYTKAEVNSLIGSISGFSYEIYASLADITNPSASVLYLIGPTGSGADKYEEYVYSNSTFVKIGDTSIDLSGYATQTWVQQQGYLTSHQTIYALTIKNSGGTTELTYTPNSGAGSITLTKGMVGLGNVENTALSTWAGSSNITTLGTITTGTWHGSTIGSSYLPSMYIGTTAVQFSSTTQNLTGIGSLTMTGALTISTTKKIYFGDTNHYVELDSNGYFHFSHGLYSDSFVSAGGISSGGGTSGIDLAAMWASLQNTDIETTYDNYQFAAAHLPTCGSGLSYTISNGIATGINVSFPVTSVAGYTGAITAQQIAQALNLGSFAYKNSLSVSDIPDLSGTYLPLTGGTLENSTGQILTINCTNVMYGVYAMFRINGANKGGVGYNDNRAYLANEITGARISVNDSGVPQYQSAFQGTAYNIYHSGNSNKSDVAWNAGKLTATYAAGDGDPVLKLNSTSTAQTWHYMAQGLAPGIRNGDRAVMAVGKTFGSYGSSAFGHYHAADASTSNHAFIGVWGIDWMWNFFGSGNMTIGTGNHTDYGYRLYVNGTGYFTDRVTFCQSSSSSQGSGLYVLDTGNTNWMRCLQILVPNLSTGRHAAFALGVDDSQYNQGQIAFYYNGAGSANNLFALGFHSQDDLLTLSAGGNVGIGLGNAVVPSYKLDVAGVIHATTGIYSDGYVTAGSASSREFKDNVQNMSLEYARNIIMSSRPITFQWNALAYSLCTKYEGDGIGFIAQEAEQLMPFAVSPIFEKYKRLDYTAYVSPLVRMSQYLLTTTDNHETRIQQLERESREKDAKIAELENKIARLTN